MGFWHWLTEISQNAAGPGQPFTAQWQYVLAALAIPALIGLSAAGIILLVEKIFGIRLSGGAI
jgi:hypothetical protein